MAIPKNYKEFCLDYLYVYSGLSAIKTNSELDKKKKNLSKEIIKGEVQEGDTVRIEAENGEFVFRKG